MYSRYIGIGVIHMYAYMLQYNNTKHVFDSISIT